MIIIIVMSMRTVKAAVMLTKLENLLPFEVIPLLILSFAEDNQ